MKHHTMGVLLCLLGTCCAGLPSCNGAAPAESARSCTITPPALGAGRLHADGTKLRDSLGRQVFLRGVNAGGRSKFPPYMPFDYAASGFSAALETYMARAQSWGIDAMRVPFTWAALEPTQGSNDADWLSRYAQLLASAWAHGIWTIVDFHQDVYAEVYCGDGFPAWTLPGPLPAPHHDCKDWNVGYTNPGPVQDAFNRFWPAGSTVQTQYLAAWDVMLARFSATPGVAGFEIINEPWVAAGEEATTLSAFYQRVIPHMKSKAPDALLFVDPIGEDALFGNTTLVPPAAGGWVFAPHYYPIDQFDPESTKAGLQKWVDVGKSWNVPVLIGEFSGRFADDSAPDRLRWSYGAFDALGLSATQWEYSQAKEDWNMEGVGIVAADGTEYPTALVLIRPYARAVAGDGISQAFDPTAGAFTASWQPTSGITEIRLPARAFPKGYRTTLVGGCYDSSALTGSMLVKADDGVSTVQLTIASK